MVPGPQDVSFSRRVWNGLKGIFIGSTHRISQSFPALTVQNLSRSFSITELQQINNAVANESMLRSSYFSREGALLRLDSSREVIVVGDLHGNTARLDQILREYGPRLAAGEISLVFLGDIIHPEASGRITDMGSSLEALNTIIRLKQQFPEQVHLLIGNHDEITPRDENRLNIKRGAIQVLVFEEYLTDYFRNQGLSSEETQKMLVGYHNFFESCALSAIIEGEQGSVFMAHSAVIRGGATEYQLVNARTNGLMSQLLWNSPTGKRTNKRDDYQASDVLATISSLNLRGGPARTYLLSGHTPDETKGWLYAPFPGVNHYIIHGNVPNSLGVVVISQGLLQQSPMVTDQVTALAS